MSGGKSSSSSTQTSTDVQETISPSNSGVVTGGNFQGQSVNVTGLTPDQVSSAISQLINFAGATVTGAASFGAHAIDQVGKTTTETTAPTQGILEKLVPIVMFGIAAYILIRVIK